MALSLGCADFTFAMMSHKESLDLIAMLRFDGVDPNAAETLRNKFADRGLEVADVFSTDGSAFLRLCDQSSIFSSAHKGS